MCLRQQNALMFNTEAGWQAVHHWRGVYFFLAQPSATVRYRVSLSLLSADKIYTHIALVG